ncbi:hypothetical protein BGW41_000240 [Actinomortierella wolfii]|nr:hypothetical protein BGW41_000240 [Actinomortierella wolfii]
MGQLEVTCFATEEVSKTLYAFAYGYNNDLVGSKESRRVGVLLKSNPAPTQDSLTWSVVSSTGIKNIFELERYISCIVDPTGVFTMFGVSNSDGSKPGGVRYDPALAATNDASGGWAKITIPIDYTWVNLHKASTLFYLKDTSGKYLVYHAFAPFLTNSTIRFGALNTATNTMENTPIVWQLPSDIPRDVKMYATQSALMFRGTYNLNRWIMALPPGPLTSTLPTLKNVTFVTADSGCLETYASSGIYALCTHRQTYGATYTVIVYDGNQLLPPIPATSRFFKENYFTSVYLTGAVGDPGSILLVVQAELLHDYGNDNYMFSTIVGTGPGAGTVKAVPNGVSVPENFSFQYTYGMPTPPSWYKPDGSGSSRSDSSLSAGAIVGLVVAIVVVIAGAAFFIIRRRKKAHLKGAEAKPLEADVLSSSPQGHFSQQSVPQPAPEPHLHPMMPQSQPMSTA